MRTVVIVGLALAANAALAQTLPPPQALPPGCEADQPCTVVKDLNESANSFTRISSGPDILSLEETARSFFYDVADSDARNLPEDNPFHPKNTLRDRDGLNAAEAAEIIAVARQLNAPKSPQAQQADIDKTRENRREWCETLNRAGTSDALLAVLEAGEAESVKKGAQKGKALLDELSPATRARVMQVLVEYRKSLTVGRQDWKKVREARPEALEMYRAHVCTNVY